MNPTLQEARQAVETAILEADRVQPRGGHRHWHPFRSREEWLRHQGLLSAFRERQTRYRERG